MTLLPGKIFDREPVMFLAVVQSAIALVAAFGLELTGEQVGGIVTFFAAVLGLVARQQVTPNEQPAPRPEREA